MDAVFPDGCRNESSGKPTAFMLRRTGKSVMNDIRRILARQRTFFAGGKTLDVKFRIDALKKLREAVTIHENDILEALRKDLNKSAFEAYATEIGMVRKELDGAIKKLPKWVRKKRVRTPLIHFLSSSYMVPEPYGVVLIMSPWNYPFQLTFAPLAGAIAAGNCAVVKPSSYSPNTSRLLKDMLGECFGEEYVAVVEGGREANRELLEQKFDYIFFTGSVKVGKVVMEAASKHLTPVTLELGGKSPCIVDKSADIELAARRIIWGKCLNSGQTCVAPDYLLVHRSVKEQLIKAMKKYITEFYGGNPCQNPEYPRIINEKHFNRLRGLMTDGRILAGGEVNEETLQISPTVIDQVSWDSQVMQEEIFGPILPVIEFSDMREVITAVKSRPKPLALYLFTNDKEVERRIIRNVSFGGGCINDTIIHLATSYMPFGGVGESGMGRYHGKWSFDTFSHEKSIMKKSNLFDIKLRYPPYGDKLNLLKRIM